MFNKEQVRTKFSIIGKAVIVASGFVLAISLCACSSSGDGGAAFESSQVETVTLGESFEGDGFEYTLKGAIVEDEFLWGMYGYEAKESTDYLCVLMDFSNDSSSELILNDAVPFTANIDGADAIEPVLYGVKESNYSSPTQQPIGSGISDEVAVVFEIPSESTDDPSDIAIGFECAGVKYQLEKDAVENVIAYQTAMSKAADGLADAIGQEAPINDALRQLSYLTSYQINNANPDAVAQMVDGMHAMAVGLVGMCDEALAQSDEVETPEFYAEGDNAFRQVVEYYKQYYNGFSSGDASNFAATVDGWRANADNFDPEDPSLAKEVEIVSESMPFLEHTEWDEVEYRSGL